MKHLKIFIKGEIIDLCKPTSSFALNSRWYSLFNDQYIIRNLSENYKKKNTPKKQLAFFKNEKKNRLILILRTKEKIYKGVVSLSFINKKKKTCDIAVVTDVNIDPKNSPYAPLEAIARITDYAFQKMKMKVIGGGAVFKLRNWQQRMELFGYKLLYVKINNNFLEKKTPNTHYVSCNYQDYLKIKKQRGGLFWDSLKKVKARIKKLPKISFRDRFISFLKKKEEKYYREIFSL